MRIILLVTLCILMPVTFAQFDIINEDLGRINIQANVGSLPLKYSPISDKDQNASNKAADIIDLIQIAPGIDPLILAASPPVGIDVPFLWLRGVAYMKNFVMTGMRQLQLKNIELRLINLRADLNVTIPRIYFEGDFHLQASLSVIPIVFRCHLSGVLLDMDISVSSGSKEVYIPPTGNVLQLDSVEINANIRDVMFNFTKMSMGGPVQAVGEPITQLFKDGRRLKGNVFNGILKTAMDIINAKLSTVSMEVFKEFLLSN